MLHVTQRPDNFDDLVGNESLKVSLQAVLTNKKTRPHTYLLQGPTGCGKTTIGRIIAKELGCSDHDLNEINSSDFRGIDTARDINRQVQFKPLQGDCRVWIIDECHKMTGDAQNALLKTLEEPPAHVYFILCTTDPQKLLPTVRNRCSAFAVSLLSDEEMFSHLNFISRKEGQKVDKKVLEQIVKDSQGTPRTALQTLTQVLEAPVEQRLAVAAKSAQEQTQSIALCRILLGNPKWREVATILEGLKDQEPESIRRHVLGYCSTVLLKSDNKKAGIVMEMFIEPFYNTGFPGLVYACYSVVAS